MRNRRERPPISRQVAQLRRQVWRRRLIALLVIAACVMAWQAYLDNRFAHLRAPEVALAAGGQAYIDARAALPTPLLQLALQASVTDFPRVGKPGELSVSALHLQVSGNRMSGRLTGYGTVSQLGAPLVTIETVEITAHKMGRFGRIKHIEITCRYDVCWDRAASSGRALADGESLPFPSSELMGGTEGRYTHGLSVEDRLVMGMSPRTGKWLVQTVQRLDSQAYVY